MHLKTGLIFLIVCLALQVQGSRGKFIYKRLYSFTLHMLKKTLKDQDIFILQNSLFGIWFFDNSARDSY